MKKLPLTRALLFIFLSTLLISGSAVLGFIYQREQRKKELRNPDAFISTLVQRVEGDFFLPSDCLCQLMELSWEKPQHRLKLDLQKMQNRLNDSPFIISAQLFYGEKPSELLVTYKPRLAWMRVTSLENSVIDGQGRLLLDRPFFETQSLPLLTIEPKLARKVDWGEPLLEKRWLLTLNRVNRELSCQSVKLKEGEELEVTLLNEKVLLFDSSRLDEGLKYYRLLEEKKLLEEVSKVDLRYQQIALLF